MQGVQNVVLGYALSSGELFRSYDDSLLCFHYKNYYNSELVSRSILKSTHQTLGYVSHS
jgi:hypothetical protein